MSRILAVRGSNVQLAADGLADAGYGLHLGTNTLRHFRRQKFGTVRKGCATAWSRSCTTAGRARTDRPVASGARCGTTSASSGTSEPSRTRSGGAPAGTCTGTRCGSPRPCVRCRPTGEFRDALSNAWADAVEAAGYSVSEECERSGCACGGKGHGFDLRPLNQGEEGQAARYLYKDGDKAKGGVAKIGLELAGQNFKAGQQEGRMGPLDLGDAAAAELLRLGKPGPLVEKYREREFGVFQVRKHYRTQNLNKLIKALDIKQDTRTEEQITDDTEGLTAIAVIPAGDLVPAHRPTPGSAARPHQGR